MGKYPSYVAARPAPTGVPSARCRHVGSPCTCGQADPTPSVPRWSAAMQSKMAFFLALALLGFEARLDQGHQVTARQPMPSEPTHALEQFTRLAIRREMHAVTIRGQGRRARECKYTRGAVVGNGAEYGGVRVGEGLARPRAWLRPVARATETRWVPYPARPPHTEPQITSPVTQTLPRRGPSTTCCRATNSKLPRRAGLQRALFCRPFDIRRSQRQERSRTRKSPPAVGAPRRPQASAWEARRPQREDGRRESNYIFGSEKALWLDSAETRSKSSSRSSSRRVIMPPRRAPDQPARSSANLPLVRSHGGYPLAASSNTQRCRARRAAREGGLCRTS